MGDKLKPNLPAGEYLLPDEFLRSGNRLTSFGEFVLRADPPGDIILTVHPNGAIRFDRSRGAAEHQ